MSALILDSQQIEELKCSLLARKLELEAQLSSAAATTKPVTLDQQSVGRVSRIDAIQQQHMAIANQQQAQLLLKRIELSLERIDNEAYGYCLHCEEPIAFARLVAQPFASLCVECQAISENS